MLIVGDCIITEDIADCRFCCDLEQCQGQCCVEGDDGAPVEEDEIAVMEEIYPQVKPYMTEEGRKAVEEQGVTTLDRAGEPCTPLVEGRECAYVAWRDGKALCAIEMAYREGKIEFAKPVSCHLYPIRVDNFGEFRALNYHRWDVCRCAVAKGKNEGVPLYRYLREPLIRKFGQEWYDELVLLCENYIERKK